HQGVRDGMVAVLDRVGALALVLPAVDRPGGLARRKARLVQPQSRYHPLHLGEPADAAREHAGLAGAGAGEDEIVAKRGADGFALRVVERVDQVRDIHRTHCSGCGVQPFLKKPPMVSNAPTTMPATPSHCGKALSCVAVSLAEPSCTRVSVCW